MRENERKGERVGRAESFPPKSFINGEDDPLQCLYGGFYSQPLIQNTKKKPKEKAITGGQNGKKTKKRTKSQKVKKQHEQCWKLEQCIRVKIRKLRNFTILLHFLCFAFCFYFLLVFDL